MRQRINPLVNLGRTSPVAQRVAANTYVAAARSIANQWWLPSGIVAADVVAAYQPRGADNAADALVNVSNPGTNNATYHTTAVRWDRARGWWNSTEGGSLIAGAALGPTLGANYTIAMAIAPISLSAGRWLDRSGTGSAFYVTTASNQFQVRLGLAGDVVNCTQGTGTRTLIIADHDVYENGAALATITGTAELAATLSLVIGNTNTFGAPMNGEIHALAIFNKTLTAPQALALHDAMRRI